MDITAPDPDPLAPTGATIHFSLNEDFYDAEAEFLFGTEEEKRVG